MPVVTCNEEVHKSNGVITYIEGLTVRKAAPLDPEDETQLFYYCATKLGMMPAEVRKALATGRYNAHELLAALKEN